MDKKSEALMKRRLIAIAICLALCLVLGICSAIPDPVGSILTAVLVIACGVALFGYGLFRGLGLRFVLSYTNPNAEKKERIASMQAMLDDPSLPRHRRLWITKVAKGDDTWSDDDDPWIGGAPLPLHHPSAASVAVPSVAEAPPVRGSRLEYQFISR